VEPRKLLPHVHGFEERLGAAELLRPDGHHLTVGQLVRRVVLARLILYVPPYVLCISASKSSAT
jgi:hypothetical protein